MMYCERGAVERVVYGLDRYRPLSLQTPGRNRAKGREWARLPALIAPDPLCASPAGQYIPTTLTRQKAGAFTGCMTSMREPKKSVIIFIGGRTDPFIFLAKPVSTAFALLASGVTADFESASTGRGAGDKLS